jgi:hypothetical protein
MKPRIFIAICLLPFFVLANDGQDYVKTTANRGIMGLRNYEVVFASEEDELSSLGGTSLIQDYYIIKIGKDDKYIIIDSLQTRIMCAGDSNCIVYESMDDSLTYLISITLSPVLTYDTLIALKNKDGNNWISTMESIFRCSIKDSIIVYNSWRISHMGALNVIKIKSDNKWELRYSVRNAIDADMTLDFSQFLICTFDSIYTGDYRPGCIYIYDVYKDSLYLFDIPGCGITRANRLFRDSSVYYLKCDNKDCNIWRITQEGAISKITDVYDPYYVSDFSIHERERGLSMYNSRPIISDRHISYSICNWNDRAYSRSVQLKLEDY